jgi:hypothetical protein
VDCELTVISDNNCHSRNRVCKEGLESGSAPVLLCPRAAVVQSCPPGTRLDRKIPIVACR